MKVLSWNMARKSMNWNWLIENVDFDIAFVQEAPYPTGFESELKSVIHRPKKKLGWGTALVSRKIELQEFKNLNLGYWGYRLNGSIAMAHAAGDAPLWFASLHCGHKTVAAKEFIRNPIDGFTPEKSHVPEISIISHLLSQKLIDKPFIIGGDINASHAHSQSRNEESIFKSFSQSHFHDTREVIHDEERQTFFKEGSKPSQLDHIYTDATSIEKIVDWQVMTEVVLDLHLSDHAPVVVNLNFITE